MKWGKLLLGVGWACVLYACSDDDGKDDTIMNMSELTGKYWYYNAWLGDKYGMGQSDLLEVIRFEKGGVLKMMEFGGRRVHAIGTWTGGDNQITMDLDDGDSIVWNVQRSGPDYIQTIVNAQGERKYTTDPGYLGELIKGESYRVRLTALMFEPGVDVINDEYSSANLQAVTYFSRGFLWE